MKRLMVKQITYLMGFIFSLFLVVDTSYAYLVSDENVQINGVGIAGLVEFLITNPDGKKLGYNLETQEYYKEFEGGYTNIMPEGESVFSGSEAGFNLIEGTYMIETIGAVKLTKFYMGIRINSKDNYGGFEVEGVIDKGLTSKFEFVYSSDGLTPWSLTRVATFSSLKQDIELAHKVGWIKNKGIMQSLLKKAEAIEGSIERDRSTRSAENQLNALIKEIKAIKSKHIDDKAVTMLTEDVEYLLENL
ncbi:MAG: hypothetical protein KAT46_00455 [Deltaproteobacteria bacterium]|nr:hypothetical protein [Deltaproteobacteria bacterium]